MSYVDYSIMAQPMDVLKMVHGSEPYIDTFPEASSQAFYAGDLVYINAGYVTECGSDPAAILGVALEDSHNDTTAGTHHVAVLVATAETILTMRVYHSNSTYNKIEAADMGAVYGVVQNGNGDWRVDKTETSNTRVRIVCFAEPVGTVAGKVGVIVLPTIRQFG